MRTRILLTIFCLVTAFALTEAAQAQLTPVTSCGQVLNAAGEYVLTTDLNCSGTPGDYNGVSIVASNVVFHLAGHAISSTDCDLNRNISGIFVAGGVTGVRIDGGKVSGFNDGVLLSSSNSRVEGMTVTDSCAFGILVQGRNNSVETSVVKRSGDGVALSPARNARITSNDLSGNVRAGVAISDFSQNNLVENNILNNNGAAGEGYGVAIFNGTNNLILNNAANYNDFGIRISSGNNTVTNNTVNGNSRIGIWITLDGGPSLVRRNTALGNRNTDLLDESVGCDSNTWRNNTFATDLVANVSDGGAETGCIR